MKYSNQMSHMITYISLKECNDEWILQQSYKRQKIQLVVHYLPTKDAEDLDLSGIHKVPAKLTYVENVLKAEWVELANSLIAWKEG